MTDFWSRIQQSALRPVRVSTLGTVSWDELIQIDAYPAESGFSYVRRTESTPGGTTANSTMALSRLGAEVSFFSIVGNDPPGARILETYRSAGMRTEHIHVVEADTDVSYVLVSNDSSERTILWKQGPYLKRGDRIDIDGLFDADVVLLDPIDFELRKFLTDLPAHTRPMARILGPLSYLCEADPFEASDIALRHDVIVGDAREFATVFGVDQSECGVSELQGRMVGANCRLAVLTRGAQGSTAVTQSNRWDCPAADVQVVDTTGAGDAFAGAIAFGMAHRWEPPQLLAFASVVSAAAISQFGAQIGLPTLEEVLTKLTASQ